MKKYKDLIIGLLVVTGALAVIVWLMREQSAMFPAQPSEDNNAPLPVAEGLDGLAPDNETVTVSPVRLTYNVPQPGTAAPATADQDNFTALQNGALYADSTEEELINLAYVNLPSSDFIM